TANTSPPQATAVLTSAHVGTRASTLTADPQPWLGCESGNRPVGCEPRRRSCSQRQSDVSRNGLVDPAACRLPSSPRVPLLGKRCLPISKAQEVRRGTGPPTHVRPLDRGRTLAR